ncbi:MAG: hypothetical protein KIS73_28085 [Enhydrobacter sp.]|nr:hypothetical protein [Enhydrobacter sp.]
MATTRKQEERALSADERELVEKSRPPALRSLTDSQLATLVKRMRVRRDKARTVAERQRREMRGKATARGAKPSKADEGSQIKLSVLSTALRRLDTEAARRTRAKAKTSLVESARKALALKQKAGRAAPAAKPIPGPRAARAGRGGKERTIVENHVPPSARGRVRKQTARVQAKRDSRPK